MILSSKDYFENFFKLNVDSSYSKSLFLFFEEIVRPRMSSESPTILDLGAGHYSLFEDVKFLNARITAIDFSSNALKNVPSSNILYLEGNVTDLNFFPPSTYDLIFDSHCFNCLTDKDERDLAFNNVYRGLKPEGFFASEMMVQPIGAKISMPFKMVNSAFELEQEIISHGFKILYFTISRGHHFSGDKHGHKVECDLVNVVVQK